MAQRSAASGDGICSSVLLHSLAWRKRDGRKYNLFSQFEQHFDRVCHITGLQLKGGICPPTRHLGLFRAIQRGWQPSEEPHKNPDAASLWSDTFARTHLCVRSCETGPDYRRRCLRRFPERSRAPWYIVMTTPASKTTTNRQGVNLAAMQHLQGNF